MIYKKFLPIVLLLGYILQFSACNKENNPAEPSGPKEAEILAVYLESSGNYINATAPVFISAADVRNNQINKANQVILDLNASCDFKNKGHIEGAVNIKLRDLIKYYKENNLNSVDKVVITCATGQQTSYAVALLRLYGYQNVYGMMWGMSSWNPELDSWSQNISDVRAAEMETTVREKNQAGDFPGLYTGKTEPDAILKARVEELLSIGFDNVIVSNEYVFLGLQDYYIINYAPIEHYLKGHVPNSIHYNPGGDFKIDKYLKTLPTNKTIIVYCSTGQTSAHAAAFLCTLGYNAKTMLFGNNGMNHSSMAGKKFSAQEINSFPIVH